MSRRRSIPRRMRYVERWFPSLQRSSLRRRSGSGAEHEARAELALAQAEIARLRAEQQRIVDADRATGRVRELADASGTLGDEGDHLWHQHAETVRLRATLLELCTQVDLAVRAIRHDLTGGVPLQELDRRSSGDGGTERTADRPRPVLRVQQ